MIKIPYDLKIISYPTNQKTNIHIYSIYQANKILSFCYIKSLNVHKNSLKDPSLKGADSHVKTLALAANTRANNTG